MALGEEHLKAVERAAKELNRKRDQVPMKWLFTNGHRPFIVAVGRNDLRLQRHRHTYTAQTHQKVPSYAKNKLGYVEAISVGERYSRAPTNQQDRTTDHSDGNARSRLDGGGWYRCFRHCRPI